MFFIASFPEISPLSAVLTKPFDISTRPTFVPVASQKVISTVFVGSPKPTPLTSIVSPAFTELFETLYILGCILNIRSALLPKRFINSIVALPGDI